MTDAATRTRGEWRTALDQMAPSEVDITEDRQAVRIVKPDGTISLVTFWATPEPSDKQHAERDQSAGPDALP